MKVGEPVLVRGHYIRSATPERVDGVEVETVLVRVAGHRAPMRVPASYIEPVERSRIRITEVDFAIDRPRFSKSVRRLRQSANLSQEELAQRLGVTQRAVSKWERGEVAPRLDRVASLASLFGVSVAEMLEAKDVPAL